MRGYTSKYEFLLYLVNQPELLIFAEAIRGVKCLFIPRVGYIINDAQLASDILLHPNFGSSGDGAMGSLITPFTGKYGLFNMDGEDHTAFKRTMMKCFTREYVNHCIDVAGSAILADLQAQLRAGDTVDMVHLTRQFTTAVMLYMFGVDLATIDLVSVEPLITDAVMHYMSKLHLTKIALTPKEEHSVFARIAMINTLIDGHQRANQDDSLLQMVRDTGLSKDEARGMMIALLVAGTETTNVTIPRVLALLVDSGQYHRLKTQPELMPSTLEEGVRVTTASPMIPRVVDTDTHIGDYHFKAGRRVLMIVYNMMKQEGDLASARQFDITRSIPQKLRHLNFGRGAHFCLGFPLAQRELELVLHSLLDLDKSPEIISRRYSRGQTFPAYTSLKVRLV